MATRRSEQVAQRLDDAERHGMWLLPQDKAEEAALRVRAVEDGLLQPFPGCFARARSSTAMSIRQRAYATIRTLAVRYPSWVFCLQSAALVHGLWVSNALASPIHIVRPAVYGRVGTGIARHRCRLDADELSRCQGICVTSLERTLMDCLCASDFQHALPIVDAALHWGLADADGLQRYFDERGRGRRGIRRARETLAHADGRSGSGGESVARAVMIELGFQVPELQVELFDPMEPNNPKYGDFGWLLSGSRPIIGELDGMEKYKRSRGGGAASLDGAVRAMSRERRREAHLNLTNVKIVRFSLSDVHDTAYFERLLTEAGVPRMRAARVAG